MTLADFVRKYLEERRKICENKARNLNVSPNNLQFHFDNNQDVNLNVSNNHQYFSNNLEPKSDKPCKSNNCKSYKVTKGVYKQSRIVTLPDGTIQSETIIRDTDGNEEKHIIHHKNGKKHTTIIRKNASGDENVVEKVGDNEVLPYNQSYDSPGSQLAKQNLVNGFDYWFEKLFKSKNENSIDDEQSTITTFDPNVNDDERIEKILKDFGLDGNLDPFSGVSKKKDLKARDNFNGEMFPDLDDFPFTDFIRKIVENSVVIDPSQDNYPLRNGNPRIQQQMEKIFKNSIFPKTPSMFEQFAEDAYIELPDESTPLDKFIEPDEERLEKLIPKWQRNRHTIEKLDEYFFERPEIKSENNLYSGLNDSTDSDLPFISTQYQTEFIPSTIHSKLFEPYRVFESGNIQTPGKMRIESVERNHEGNISRKIAYSLGNKHYTIEIISNPSGMEIKRMKKLNFPESELPDFKHHWSEKYHSDFDN